MSSKLMPDARWPLEEIQTTRELNSGVEGLSMASLSRLKRRKWERWLVPNCVSKPSTVFPSGTAMMPALLTRTFSLELLERNSAAHLRTLSSEPRSMCKNSIWEGLKKLAQASSPFFTFLTVKNNFAPVLARARAASTPIPLDAPVIRMTLSVSLPSRSSSLMICRAVGRESPGP